VLAGKPAVEFVVRYTELRRRSSESDRREAVAPDLSVDGLSRKPERSATSGIVSSRSPAV